MPLLSIRNARPDDLERMVAIEIAAAERFPLDVLPADVGRCGSREETQRAILDGLAWVADTDDAGVVGFLAAQIEDRCLHVAEMDVLPSHGRQGIGGRLLEHACAQAPHRGLLAVTLTTFEQVPWNAPFYARHGFTATDEPPRFEHLRRALAHERARGLTGRVAMLRGAEAADAPRDAPAPTAQASMPPLSQTTEQREIDPPTLEERLRAERDASASSSVTGMAACVVGLRREAP